MGFFTPFDTKVDPKLGEALKKLNNAGNVIHSAIQFESAFIGTSTNDAKARSKKILDMLAGENQLFKEEFKKEHFESINHDDVENFSGACTLIKSKRDSINSEFNSLTNVSKSIIAIVDILLQSGSFDIKAVDELKKLKNVELVILSHTKDVERVFTDLYHVLDNLARDIDDGIYNQKDWDKIRVDALNVIKDVENCEVIIKEIDTALRRSFTMLRDVITIDEKVKANIEEHLNMIIHGNPHGPQKAYSGESYTAKDRRNELFAYNEELKKKAS